MGPAKAMKLFAKENPDAESYEVILYGSLSDTGKGHGTDIAIAGVAGKPVNIIFDKKNRVLPHENTMDIFAVREGKRDKKSLMRVMSVGGGDIEIEDRETSTLDDIYKETSFAGIAEICNREGKTLSDYVYEREGEKIIEFLAKV
jgi:L-serine dehydratase